jgi:hypothetical protein
VHGAAASFTWVVEEQTQLCELTMTRIAQFNVKLVQYRIIDERTHTLQIWDASCIWRVHMTRLMLAIRVFAIMVIAVFEPLWTICLACLFERIASVRGHYNTHHARTRTAR